MHAYLLIGNDPDKIEEEINKIAKKKSSKILKFLGQKIEEIREVNKFTSLTLGEKTAIVIKNVDLSTTEALNAFLKNLEEPQKNLTYILTASSIHRILPTISSRCQVVFLTGKKAIENSEKIEELFEMKTSQKLAFFDKIKERKEAVDFMKDFLEFTHQEIVKGEKDHKSLAQICFKAQETLSRLEMNGNVNLQLTNFAVNTENFATLTQK